MKKTKSALPLVFLMFLLSNCVAHTKLVANDVPQRPEAEPTKTLALKHKHVLLVSVDGLHSQDVVNYVRWNPHGAIAGIFGAGSFYPRAMTTLPSDSFPGLAAIVTGSSPKTNGIIYDVSFDRALRPPGSDCSGNGSNAGGTENGAQNGTVGTIGTMGTMGTVGTVGTVGTTVTYDQSIDINPDRLDGGGGINTATLPRDPARNCAPVFPHEYLRVNTVFEVIKAHGGYTSWADKHLAYEFVNGPGGHGVDDLYTPEIDANPEAQPGGVTSSVPATEKNDELKVQAVLNQIAGKDHSGSVSRPVPQLFGMNFQSVSVGQKLSGYQDSAGHLTPDLRNALDFVDQALQKMRTAIVQQGLGSSTMIIVTAKHGQSPIDPAMEKIVSNKKIPALISTLDPKLLASATQDDIVMLWLNDHDSVDKVVGALSPHMAELGFDKFISGMELAALFGDPITDSRAPDLVIRPQDGVIYSSPNATKKAEHGGFSNDDRNVALLVYDPRESKNRTIAEDVDTKQIAVTLLTFLGLSPQELKGVQIESTQALP